MSVYIDPMMRCIPNGRWRWSLSCHLFSDNLDELHAFARRIGLRREWFQQVNRLPHYDLNESRREKAVACGVIELSRREAVEFWNRHWPRRARKRGG